MPFGLGAGRLGNFINGGELWGRVDLELPLHDDFPGLPVPKTPRRCRRIRNGNRCSIYGALPRHASQLYELALEGVVLFLILNLFIRKPRLTGSVSGLFLIGYGLFRIIVVLPASPGRPSSPAAGCSTSVWGRFFRSRWCLVGIIMMVWAYRHRPQQQNS
ncbi:prolipoprotein diacylglyceryl transferase [Klebsiella pneumoniae]|nr:prolipoprotein diacylglyceryl transferase [Klebsiella pneumoniae]